jgi:hypothetical protein
MWAPRASRTRPWRGQTSRSSSTEPPPFFRLARGTQPPLGRGQPRRATTHEREQPRPLEQQPDGQPTRQTDRQSSMHRACAASSCATFPRAQQGPFAERACDTSPSQWESPPKGAHGWTPGTTAPGTGCGACQPPQCSCQRTPWHYSLGAASYRYRRRRNANERGGKSREEGPRGGAHASAALLWAGRSLEGPRTCWGLTDPRACWGC